MKLELKHLAPYLPYRLKTFIDHKVYYNTRFEILALHTNSKANFCCVSVVLPTHSTWRSKVYVSSIKPLLLPLSALTEPLPDGTVPIIELAKIHLDWVEGNDFNLKCEYKYQRQINVQSTWNNIVNRDPYFNDNLFIQTVNVHKNEYWINEYLFANHFDVWNLIENGIAIDKRNIKL